MTEPTARSRALGRALRALAHLPEPLHRVVRGPVARNARGDELDRDLRLLCRLEALQSQELAGREVGRARRDFVDSCAVVEGEAPALAETVDTTLPGPRGPIRVRWYAPLGAVDRALVYLHGGGWVVGDLRTHDVVCRTLAAEGRQVVVAVDYALAPEHPYPHGLQDALAAFVHLRGELAARGISRVGIGGDSAGGNLAAAACLALRDRGLPQPDVQLLVYPATDLRKLGASHREFAAGYLLTSDSIDWYLARYGVDVCDPRASVLLEPDLTGLAPAVVATAGFDPLRDEGEAYAARLAEAGVPVADLRFGALLHGFFSMGALPSCRRAVSDVVRAVDATRSRPTPPRRG
jgi:acetyl esterase